MTISDAHDLIPPASWLRRRCFASPSRPFSASSSASTLSALRSSAISSSSVLGGAPRLKRVGLALGEVGMALEHVEAREGVVDLGAGIKLAKPGAVLGALHPGHDRVLAGAGLAQLVLKLGDVGLGRAQRVVEHLDLGLELVGHVGRLLLLEQGRLGEVLAVLGERELGLLDPARPGAARACRSGAASPSGRRSCARRRRGPRPGSPPSP